MTKKFKILTVFIIVTCGILVLYDFNKRTNPMVVDHDKRIPVTTRVVHSIKWQDTRTILGNIVAINGVNVNSQVEGLVTNIYFKSGEKVKQAQPLVKLWDDDVRAELQKAEAQLFTDTKTYNRVASLVKVGGTSQQEVDNALGTVLVDKANIATQKALLYQRLIRAPFTGFLGIRNINLGQHITVADTITSINQLDSLYLDFAVPEDMLSWFSINSKIAFKLNSMSRNSTASKIMYATILAGSSQIATSIRSLNVRALFNNSKYKLLPGTAVSVFLASSPVSRIIIPQSALDYTPDGVGVYIVSKNHQVHWQKIAVGEQGADSIVVLSGLTTGDTIVLSGQQNLYPNAMVKAMNVDGLGK